MLCNIKSIEVGRYKDVEIGKIEIHHFHDNFMFVDMMNIVFKDFANEALFFNFQKIHYSILEIELKNHKIHSMYLRDSVSLVKHLK